MLLLKYISCRVIHHKTFKFHADGSMPSALPIVVLINDQKPMHALSKWRKIPSII